MSSDVYKLLMVSKCKWLYPTYPPCSTAPSRSRPRPPPTSMQRDQDRGVALQNQVQKLPACLKDIISGNYEIIFCAHNKTGSQGVRMKYCAHSSNDRNLLWCSHSRTLSSEDSLKEKLLTTHQLRARVTSADTDPTWATSRHTQPQNISKLCRLSL